MNKADRVDAFINILQALPDLENVFNPWKETDPVSDNPMLDAPAIRRENLRRYLLPRVGQARWLLVAEAPGYNGCKFSGIAMTSERQLLTIPDRIGLAPECRVSTVVSGNNPHGRAERTASIVWRLLAHIPACNFVLWNAFPCHPHQPGNMLRNGTPTEQMLDATRHVLAQMLAMFPEAEVVAVGKKALSMLPDAKFQVRHPSNDTKQEFPRQIDAVMNRS